MRTRSEINEERSTRGLVGSTEAVIELLFDIRNLLLEFTSVDLASRRKAAYLDGRDEVIEDRDIGL